MRDVANRAAVSMATVSHVINGTRHVSPELTERVRVVMEELNYQPDAVARSLRRRRTLTIGLLVPSTEIPFFASVAHCIERAASRALGSRDFTGPWKQRSELRGGGYTW